MSHGFDTTGDCYDHGQEIIKAGFHFVGRYYFSGISHAKTKLAYSEAQHLSKMGINLVAVFENAGDHAGYFDAEQGASDGQEAFTYARTVINQPAGSAVYFAVDYDASELDLRTRIIPYFEEVRKSMGAYLCGVYGSGYICEKLLEMGLVHYTWLAQAEGWEGSDTFTAWNIRQGDSGTEFGLSVDADVVQGPCGWFTVV